MNPHTGQIYEGTPGELTEIKAQGIPLIPIPERDIENVRAMTIDERKAYAKRVRNRRKKAKQRRKADRKRRGRR